MESKQRPNLKRKIHEISKDDLPTKISHKLHHELNEARHACKKAKVFETQKLVKKLKGLRKDSSDPNAVQDHEAQLSAIKDIDTRCVTNTAFKTKVFKDRMLKDNELMKTALENEIQSNVISPAPPATALGKVQSRLLSSKLLSAQILTSLDAMKSLVDPEHAPQQKKSRIASAEPSTVNAAAPSKHNPIDQALKPNYLPDDDSDPEIAGDDDGWESGSIGDNAGLPASGSSSQFEASELGTDADDTDNDSDIDEDDVPPRLAGKAPSKSAVSQASSSKVQESTFLPSLATGYISGSDDSDAEAEAAVAEPRKNRRGQRARRAIWEKKYGRNANHKKTQAKVEAEAKPRKGRSFGKQGEKRTNGRGGPQLSGSNLTSQGNQKRFGPRPGGSNSTNQNPAAGGPSNPASKPLHPSWEAKRKLKEKQSDTIVPSQGKKIKF